MSLTMMNCPPPADMTNVGKTKVEHYGWKVVDEPGEFVWINKLDLAIDDGYQRDAISMEKVFKIAREWSWIALGALIVSDRGEDGYFVIEGQHRLLASLKRSDVYALPCLVFKVETRKSESEAFRRINRERRMVAPIDVFKARVFEGDETAMFINETLANTGFKVSKDGKTKGSVRFVSILMSAAEGDKELFTRIWNLTAKVCEGYAANHKVFKGLMYLETHMPVGRSLMDDDLLQRLERYSLSEILSYMHNGAMMFGAQQDKHWASGLLVALNHKRTTHKLELIDT